MARPSWRAVSETASRLRRRLLWDAISLIYGDALYRAAGSMAVQGHKDMLVTSSLDDVMLTSAFTGLPLCKLRLSIVAVGLDPDALPERGMIDITKDINPDKRPKRWKDTWSAGYTVSGVIDIPNVETLVDCLADEYLNSE